MRIELSITEAEARLAGHPSRPLSKIGSGDQPTDIGWWLSNPKHEIARSARHRNALNCYLWIGAQAVSALQQGFPAVFSFADGEIRRPDKGAIKAFASGADPLLTSRVEGTELVFELTPVGVAWCQTLI